MRLVPGFQLRQFGPDYVAVPSGVAAQRFNGLISLNETGSFLFEALQQPTDRAALLAALEAEYDAPREQLKQDLEEFLARMEELGLLEETT